VAIEKNPEGADYLKKNILLNKVEDVVEAFQGDVSKIVTNLDGDFDRIIMPLPGSAQKFLDLGFEKIRDGGIIHYYRFVEDNNWEKIENEIKTLSEDFGRDYSIKEKNICGQRAANIDRACIQIMF
jgi:tRNA G37 N-methylase Trm5